MSSSFRVLSRIGDLSVLETQGGTPKGERNHTKKKSSSHSLGFSEKLSALKGRQGKNGCYMSAEDLQGNLRQFRLFHSGFREGLT